MALIHILDGQADEIVGTLNTEKGQVDEPLMTRSIDNFYRFEMTALANFDLLTKRNRLLVQDADGFFNEFIITYTDQYEHNKKEVRSLGSFIDLQTAKTIPAETLLGVTPLVAVTTALRGTEHRVGIISYTGNIRTIEIEPHMQPYDLLKLTASTFNLEMRHRIEVVGNKIIRYVDMVEEIAGFEGKEIEFGKDLIGIRRVEDGLNIVTALVGLGPPKEDGTRLEVYVEDQEALERWGRNGRHLVRVYEPQSDDEEMTEARLRQLTEAELKKRNDAVVTYECEAVSIESDFGRSHEAIRYGQTVRIKDEKYVPPIFLKARIREETVNVANHEIVNFKIGNYVEYKKEDLEKQVAALRKLMAQKVDDARLRYEIGQTEKMILVQDTDPENPEVGQKYINTSGDYYVLKEFDGAEWNDTGPTEASDIGAVGVDIQHENGLLWSTMLGLIVERSDGKMRSVKSGTDGDYIEQKVGTEWVKVFWVDTNGNLMFAGDLVGASGTFGIVTIGGVVDGKLTVLDSAGIEIATIDKDGIIVTDAEFLIKDSVTGALSNTVVRTNLIVDHSFEMLPINYSGTPLVNSGFLYYPADSVRMIQNSIYDWKVSGSPPYVQSIEGTDLDQSIIMYGYKQVLMSLGRGLKQIIEVSPGETYTLSAHFGRPQGTLASTNPRVSATFLDGSMNIIDGVNHTYPVPQKTGASNSYERRSFTVTPPPGTWYIEFMIFSGSGGYVAVDGVQCVVGNLSAPYVDDFTVFAYMNGWRKADHLYTESLTTNSIRSTNNVLKFEGHGTKIYDFQSATGSREGYFGRVAGTNASNSFLALYNLISQKAFWIYDDGRGVYNGPFSAPTITQTSRREEKRDIEPYEGDSLDIINRTKVRSFNFNDDEPDAKRKIGIIVDEAPTELISEGEYGADITGTLFLAVKAIQELSAEVNGLKSEIEQLKSK